MSPSRSLSTSLEELGHLSESDPHHLDLDPEEEGGQYEIDPLSDESLAALRRLARYRPHKDNYPFPEGRAAVLVALFGSRSGKNLNVLLSTRAKTLRTFPGQVALPGGKVDVGDINLEAAARREAFEEVGLPTNPECVRYLTSLPPFLSRSLLLVTPVVVFILDASLRPEINPSEVDKLFSFPLSGFLQHKLPSPSSPNSDPSMLRHVSAGVREGSVPYHDSHDYTWFDGSKHRFHSFQTEPVGITGLTAEILIQVAEVAYGRAADFPTKAPGQFEGRELIRRVFKNREEMEQEMGATPPSGTGKIKGKL
ncbi:hypothetical protein T439DRAFT_330292 [Meredithblackwellia eburnea MCA 4105]